MSRAPDLLAELLAEGALEVRTPPEAPELLTVLFLDGDAHTIATSAGLDDPVLLADHHRRIRELDEALQEVRLKQALLWAAALLSLVTAMGGAYQAGFALGQRELEQGLASAGLGVLAAAWRWGLPWLGRRVLRELLARGVRRRLQGWWENASRPQPGRT